jgi:PAS domain S-box-containing protein
MYFREQNTGSPGTLLDGLDLDEEYLLDPNNWVSHAFLHVLYHRMIAALGDENSVYKMALASERFQSLGLLDGLARLVGSPKLIYAQASKYNRLLKLNGDVHIHELGDSWVVLEDRYHSSAQKTRYDCDYTRGVLVGIPTIFDMPPAYVEEIECQVASDTYGVRTWPDAPIHGAKGCLYRVRWDTEKNIPFLKRLFGRRAVYRKAIADLQEANSRIQDKYEEVKRLASDLETANRRLLESKQQLESNAADLRTSEERYRFLADNVSDTIWTFSLETMRFTYASPSIGRMRGFTSEESMQLSLEETLAPQSLEAVMKALAEELAKEGEVDIDPNRHRTLEIQQLCKDGSYAWTEATMSFIRDEKGQPVGALGVTRDISDRKRAEEAIRMTLQRFYTVLSSMYTGLVLVTDEGRVEFVNQAICDYFDLDDSPADLVGLASADLLTKIRDAFRYPDEAIARIGEIVDQGQPVQGEEVALTGDRELLRDFIPIYINGKSYGRLWLHMDITERQRAEEALRRAHDELEKRIRERTTELQRAYDKLIQETRERGQLEQQLHQAHKMEAIGTLAGGIAHDFNNILAAIIGFSEMAIDKAPEGTPARNHMERVFSAGLRGRKLVKQILTFSRQAEQDKQPLKLAPVVNEAIGLIRASLPSTVEIRTNLQSTFGFVLADPIQIQQIILNLCTNAADALRRTAGSISIDLVGFSFSSADTAPDPTMSPGFYAKLSVTDTGEGMSPETIQHIFDPFFTTKAVGEGTGLGLSVVHGIVASHGGTITVSSQPGKGSTFAVYLPKFIEEQSPEAADGDSLIPRGRERILFIDDEKDLTAIADEMLTDLGYRVTSRTGAREALTLFRLDPSRFDLVITDQTMPEITGEDLAKEILAIRGDMPVVMCTGFSHLVDADGARVAGIKAFAMKPLTKGEIARTIRKVLDE